MVISDTAEEKLAGKFFQARTGMSRRHCHPHSGHSPKLHTLWLLTCEGGGLDALFRPTGKREEEERGQWAAPCKSSSVLQPTKEPDFLVINCCLTAQPIRLTSDKQELEPKWELANIFLSKHMFYCTGVMSDLLGEVFLPEMLPSPQKEKVKRNKTKTHQAKMSKNQSQNKIK